jgi:hypothetical protein
MADPPAGVRAKLPDSLWWRALLVVLLVWAGMLLGVSFMTIPTIFGTPELERPIAFAVVRRVFTLFTWIQAMLAGSTLLLVFAAQPRGVRLLLVLIAIALVLLQFFILLPELAARTELILAGETLSPSWTHRSFELAEFIKVTVLLIASVLLMRRS